MGRLSDFLRNGLDSNSHFIEIVRASENGEEWAKNELQKMWNSNDSTLLPRVFCAYVTIYKDAAYSGDREAIIKYARGLEWSNREDEALEWYMKLIDNGDTDAMLELALDYSEFGGMGENKEEHNKWIFAAANAGNAEALDKAGTILTIDGNLSSAKSYYKASAEKGYPEGKANYADCLHLDMVQISAFKNGTNNQRPECLNDYVSDSSNLSRIVIDLYYKIEDLYLDALSELEDESALAKTLGALSRFYLYPPKKEFAPAPYRSAFFAYIEYIETNNEIAFRQFEEIVSDYNLDICESDLEKWASGLFEDWIDEKGITEGEPLFDSNDETLTEINVEIKQDKFNDVNDSFYTNTSESAAEAMQENEEQICSDIFDEEFNLILNSTDFNDVLKKADAFFLGEGEEENDYKAFALYQRCFELEPENTYIMMRIGQCYNAGYGTEENSTKAIEFLTPAAQAKEPKAMFLLGSKYKDGDGVEQDVDKALYYLTAAAEAGNADAKAHIGDIYYFGMGTEQNFELAAKWYFEATKYDVVSAIDNLALMYFRGEGVDESTEKAIEYWLRSAELGSPVAMTNIGQLYIDGIGFEKNALKAKEWFEKAAAKEDPDAYFKLGEIYEEGFEEIAPNIDKAIFWYEKGTAAKNEDSIMHLAKIYSKLNFDRINYKRALELYEILFTQFNSFVAANELGFMYKMGFGVEKSSKKAFEFYTHGAELGSVRSYTELADLYYEGEGVEKDAEKAFDLFLFAKNNGDDIARGFLDVISSDLVAEPQPDSWLAVKYLLPLAESGDASAQYKMYKAYQNGAGTEIDYEAAQKWFDKALAQNDPQALFEKGVKAYSEKNMEECVLCWEKSSASGNIISNYALGKLYLTGEYVSKDVQKGLNLIISSAQNGCIEAQRYLGFIYSNDEYVAKDISKATAWLNEAIDRGDADSLLILGSIYLCEKDYPKAEEILKLALENYNEKSGEALHGIGLVNEAYYHNYQQAFNCFLESAESGFALSQYIIGKYYYEAIGTTKNTKEALKWLNTAVSNGVTDAKNYLESINKNEKTKHKHFPFFIIIAIILIGIIAAAFSSINTSTSNNTTSNPEKNTVSATNEVTYTTEKKEQNSTANTEPSNQRKVAYVTAEPSLRLRENPNTKSEIITTIPTNKKIEVIKTNNTVSGWVYVYYKSKDLYGWVSEAYIEYEEETQAVVTNINNDQDLKSMYIQTILNILEQDLSEGEEYSFGECFFDTFKAGGSKTPFAIAFYEGKVIILHYEDSKVKVIYKDYMPYSNTVYGNGKDLIIAYQGGAPTQYSLNKYIYNGVDFESDSCLFSGYIEIESIDNEFFYSMEIIGENSVKEHMSESEFYNEYNKVLNGYEQLLTKTINEIYNEGIF